MTNTSSVQVEALGARHTSKVLRPGQRWVVGAAASCDLLVRDSAVSGRHCSLRHMGKHVELEEVDGRGAVRVGGAAVARALLPLDSVFQIGDTTVTLRLVRAEGGEVLPGMVGSSDAMQQLAQLVKRAARLDIPMMIRGESGTGKELVARAAHALSGRASGSFVAINGATLTDALAPSALFGHARGAYTGAAAMRRGAFREADGGTLFIDEVAALPPAVQTALLRAVEEGVVVPVGEDRPIRTNVRVLAATCEPLETMIKRAAFRLDLYQRLSACVVQIAPLRDRRTDLPALTRHILERAPVVARLDSAGLAALACYPFPGNVRELHNLLTQAALSCDGGVIRPADIEMAIALRCPARRARRLTPAEAVTLLQRCDGNVSAAARHAGVARSTIRDKVRQAGDRPNPIN